jgi:hypothetical protein
MPERSALNTALVVLAAIPLILAIVDFVLADGNRSRREEVSRRQQLIAESGQLTRVNQVLIREIAVTAVKSKDDKLRELLSQNGITIKIAPAASPAGDGKGE